MLQKKRERANVHLNHAKKKRQREVERRLDNDQSQINEDSLHFIFYLLALEKRERRRKKNQYLYSSFLLSNNK